MDYINIVGATAVKLQEQVKLLNEAGFSKTLTGQESYKELQTLVKEGQEWHKAQNGGGDNGTKNEAAQASKEDAVYVWLKSPSYVDQEGTKRVAGGFYHISLSDYPRLAKLPRDAGEIFTEVPNRKLTEIAKWFGINIEKYSDKQLLEMLVKEPTLY